MVCLALAVLDCSAEARPHFAVDEVDERKAAAFSCRNPQVGWAGRRGQHTKHAAPSGQATDATPVHKAAWAGRGEGAHPFRGPWPRRCAGWGQRAQTAPPGPPPSHPRSGCSRARCGRQGRQTGGRGAGSADRRGPLPGCACGCRGLALPAWDSFSQYESSGTASGPLWTDCQCTDPPTCHMHRAAPVLVAPLLHDLAAALAAQPVAQGRGHPAAGLARARRRQTAARGAVLQRWNEKDWQEGGLRKDAKSKHRQRH